MKEELGQIIAEIKTLVEKLEVSLKENETKSKEGIPLPKKIVKG